MSSPRRGCRLDGAALGACGEHAAAPEGGVPVAHGAEIAGWMEQFWEPAASTRRHRRERLGSSRRRGCTLAGAVFGSLRQARGGAGGSVSVAHGAEIAHWMAARGAGGAAAWGAAAQMGRHRRPAGQSRSHRLPAAERGTSVSFAAPWGEHARFGEKCKYGQVGQLVVN